MTYDDWKLEAPPDAPEPPEWLEIWRDCDCIPSRWADPATREDAIRDCRFAIEEIEHTISELEELDE